MIKIIKCSSVIVVVFKLIVFSGLININSIKQNVLNTAMNTYEFTYLVCLTK